MPTDEREPRSETDGKEQEGRLEQHEIKSETGVVTAEAQEQQPDRGAQPVDQEQPPRLAFPVIGIGGSAGGLEAFTELFKAMPDDSGMAFVVIQHLPPERESMVCEILSRYTKMPVSQVEDGMPIEPNHVYVIRPGRTLTIHDRVLRLGGGTDQPGIAGPSMTSFVRLPKSSANAPSASSCQGWAPTGRRRSDGESCWRRLYRSGPRLREVPQHAAGTH